MLLILQVNQRCHNHCAWLAAVHTPHDLDEHKTTSETKGSRQVIMHFHRLWLRDSLESVSDIMAVLVDLSVSAPRPQYWCNITAKKTKKKKNQKCDPSKLTTQLCGKENNSSQMISFFFHCCSAFYEADLVWAQKCVLHTATWFEPGWRMGYKLGSIQKAPALGSQCWASDPSHSMGIVWPRGSEGKTIHIGLTGMKQEG